MTVELRDDHLRIHDGGHTLDFHLRWLRHNCDQDRHPLTRERTSDSAEIPDSLAAVEVDVVDGVLRIRWAHDQRISRYPLGWLREHAYALDRRDVPPPSSNLAEIELAGFTGDTAAILQRVARFGAAVVRHESAAPEDETEAWIAAFARYGLEVVGTHFGRIEDLRTDNTTNANTDQLGYTNAGIELHTDQPFLDEPPRYQLLQSIRRADQGGDNAVVDGRAALAYLESLDAPAAALLRTVPVKFHRKQQQFERVVIAPIVDGDRIRSSYFTEAPYQVSFAEMTAWYRARDRFVRLLRDPRHHYRFALAPGDALLYDNHRVLHARTAFRGPRWVRGVYFDASWDRSG